ncbi:hypothetical protein B0H63DRAFT_482056 [Podospora didyma]|uniref:Uncharacterized protein n=1 Tax=Podospora didyma TaxID=330526 RepID=A0AAE0KEC6_9PEZI|nr:hypothetical protein B0H63DRAFT_482056 [Podospora didyma]
MTKFAESSLPSKALGRIPMMLLFPTLSFSSMSDYEKSTELTKIIHFILFLGVVSTFAPLPIWVSEFPVC